MNHYGLQVKGLEPGKYEVHLGGKKAAEYSAEELEKGVNLAGPALKVGPVADQVKTIWTLVKMKTDFFHDEIFRGVVLAGNNRELFGQRLKVMPSLDEAIRIALEM